MASKTEILNLALGHIGVGKQVADFDTEKTEEALAGRRFFDIVRDEALGDKPWPFLTKSIAAALVEEEPTTEWGYSYRYPSDCKHMRRIFSGIRNDDRQTRAPYRIVRDDSGLLIYTDEVDAFIEYTVSGTDLQFWPQDVTMAISLLLAHYLAPELTTGDPFKLGERAFRLYVVRIESAADKAFNEQQDEETPESEFISGRD